MTTNKRKEIRKRIKHGLYTFYSKGVIKVVRLTEDKIGGHYTDDEGVERPISTHSQDNESAFYDSAEDALIASLKYKVATAQRTIKNSLSNIKKAQAIIDEYPEYAI